MELCDDPAILPLNLQYKLFLFASILGNPSSIKTFKVRIINQQNNDCLESQLLNAKKIDTSIFPVQIKIKGGEHLLLKVKIIQIHSDKREVSLG